MTSLEIFIYLHFALRRDSNEKIRDGRRHDNLEAFICYIANYPQAVIELFSLHWTQESSPYSDFIVVDDNLNHISYFSLFVVCSICKTEKFQSFLHLQANKYVFHFPTPSFIIWSRGRNLGFAPIAASGFAYILHACNCQLHILNRHIVSKLRLPTNPILFIRVFESFIPIQLN